MRRRAVGAILGTALVAVSVVTYSYSTYGKWSSMPVLIYVNPANADVTSAAAVSALQFAMDVWSTAGSSFRFQYAGTSTVASQAYDNRNVILFRNVNNGSTIATTYSWWDSSNRLLDSDIVVWDGGFRFYTGTTGCGGIANSAYLEDIAMHELGHALGLNHSNAADATMYPSYSYCSQSFRTLAADDLAGLRALYPPVGNTAPTISITSPANGASFTQGSTLSLSATASDAQDGNLTSQIQWTDNGSAIGGGGVLSRTLSLLGTHVLVARVTDSGGLQASAQVSITINVVPNNTAPTVSINNPANGATFAQGTTIALSATASDAEDGNLSAQIQWVDNGTVIGTGATLSRSFATTGSHAIVARVTDSGGLQGSSQRTITVTGSATTGTLAASTSVSGYGVHRVTLLWSGLTGTYVDVYRDGVYLYKTRNSGDRRDYPGSNVPTRATYVYKVCLLGTNACTNTVTVSF